MSKSSSVVAEEPLHDLEVVEAMVAELEAYIISDDLYRTVTLRTSRGDERIQMAGGDLLARLHRLQGQRRQLSSALQSRLDSAQTRADEIIYSLKTRFDLRLHRELKARLDSLRWFIDDCIGEAQRCRANYPYEIRNRQRIEEILKRIDPTLDDEEREALNVVDNRIRQFTHGCPFIWDEKLMPIFPRSPYWYLYVTP